MKILVYQMLIKNSGMVKPKTEKQEIFKTHLIWFSEESLTVPFHFVNNHFLL